MNQEELARKRNDIARLFRHSSKIHRNCIRINTGSTYKHESKKFQMCWALNRDGKEFITEAEFENGAGRADIVCLDNGTVYEIIQSECQASIDAKRKAYPLPVIIVPATSDVIVKP